MPDNPLAAIGKLAEDISGRFSGLSGPARRRWEHRVTQLAPSHVRFVRRTLRDALAGGYLTPVEYAHLGGFFERWWAYGAPEKLAVLHRITSLAQVAGRSCQPPDGFPLSQPVETAFAGA